MITTATLEEILKDQRKTLNCYKPHEKDMLQGYYQGKFDVLEELIEISKEEEQ